MTSSFSRECSPTFNWPPSPPRHSPIVSESSHGEHSLGSQPDGIVLTHGSDYALNSQDNEIENTHENNNDGQWNGPPEFATWIGEITRSKIGLGYKTWKEVPSEYKEDIWNSVKICTRLNGVTSAQEKKRMLPAYNNKEDWEKFIDNMSDPKFLKKSEQAAEARSQVKAQYTGGRKGVPTRWNELEKESPTGQIYRPDVFLKTHRATPDDDPSSSKSQAAAKLALVKETYDKVPSAQKCLGTDAVTKARLQEEKHNVLKQKQKNEALKAQLDAERQENNTGLHDLMISNISYQQDIGMPVIPSSFGLFFLRNLRKKLVAVAYVDTKVLIDDDYNCMLHVVIEPSAMLCDRDDAVLRDVPIGTFIRWPKAYVTPVGEHSS
ncbi:hypothetical protein MKW98_004967 [Papaver atlanticum]|uniref:Transposase Tnp1/En/Spm-like domain-containing protein n=1 Tax=Papaver atlanticum TaxID=357466 RepID=A0AAD4TCT1_9MAGN|nr:hypothetical protein MKW98_004967 [Papaver atlanticum]